LSQLIRHIQSNKNGDIFLAILSNHFQKLTCSLHLRIYLYLRDITLIPGVWDHRPLDRRIYCAKYLSWFFTLSFQKSNNPQCRQPHSLLAPRSLWLSSLFNWIIAFGRIRCVIKKLFLMKKLVARSWLIKTLGGIRNVVRSKRELNDFARVEANVLISTTQNSFTQYP
jgi:hypothetical protein